jgi:ribosomal-protein-alanine N-acetyltransferase
MSDPFEIEPPVLSTPRLTLRRLVGDDAADVFAYTSDPEIARFTLWKSPPSLEFARRFVDRLTAPQFLNWAIRDLDREKVFGMVFLHSWQRHHRKAEIAFNLARERWRHGFATEAAAAVLAFAFGPLELNRVEATCMPDNPASRRVLQKLGMRHEGRMRRSHHRHDGFHDMDLFAVLRGEATV